MRMTALLESQGIRFHFDWVVGCLRLGSVEVWVSIHGSNRGIILVAWEL